MSCPVSLGAFMIASSLLRLNASVRSYGLENVVPVESVEELAHIAACDIAVHAVSPADLLGDADFVISALQEFKDLGTYQVQAKHLAVVNVEQNRAVLGLSAANFAADFEHVVVQSCDWPCWPNVAPKGGTIQSLLLLFRKNLFVL